MTRYVRRLLSPRDDHVRDDFPVLPICGVRNTGNSCYVNCVLQALANTQPIRTYCARQVLPASGKPGDPQTFRHSLLRTFASLVNALWSGAYRFITPLALKTLMAERHPTFRGTRQNDALEFLLDLLQDLRAEIDARPPPAELTSMSPVLSPTRPRPSSRLPALSPLASPTYLVPSPDSDASADECLDGNVLDCCFDGVLARQRTCLACRASSKTTESFTVLPLAVPEWHSQPPHAVSLEGCVRGFFREERPEERQWCEHCGRFVRRSERATLCAAPKVLVLQLNRAPRALHRQAVALVFDELRVTEFTADRTRAVYELYSFIVRAARLTPRRTPAARSGATTSRGAGSWAGGTAATTSASARPRPPRPAQMRICCSTARKHNYILMDKHFASCCSDAVDHPQRSALMWSSCFLSIVFQGSATRERRSAVLGLNDVQSCWSVLSKTSRKRSTSSPNCA